MRFIINIIIAGILSGLAVSVPAQQQIPTTHPYRIGLLCWSMNIPGQVAMRQGVEAEAKAINTVAERDGHRGVQLDVQVAGDGSAGIERQIGQMYKMIADKVDLIIVQPTDNAALSKPLQAANRVKIPVVAYDQYISDGKLASYITSDNYQAGYLDGEYLASLTPAGRKLKLIMVEYPHVSSTVERVNGFIDALHEYKCAYDLLKTYIAVEPQAGKLAGQAILRDFPKPGTVDAVFCVNDGGGVAVARELIAAGRNEIMMATIDGDEESVKIISRNGIIRIDTAQFCRRIGRETMKIAYRVLERQTVPEHVLVPVFPITRETWQQYLKTQDQTPASWKKPWTSKKPLWDSKLKIVR